MPYPHGPDLTKAGKPVVLATLPPIPGDPKALELQSFTTSKNVADVWQGQAVGDDLLIHHFKRKLPGWSFTYAGKQRRVGGGHGSNISRGTSRIWQSWPLDGQEVARAVYAEGTLRLGAAEKMRVGTDWFATPALDVDNDLLLLRVVHAGKEWYRVFALSGITSGEAAPAPLAEFGGWASDRWGPFQGCAIWGRTVYIGAGGTTGAAKWAAHDINDVTALSYDWPTAARTAKVLLTRHGLVAGDPAMSSELEDLEVLTLDRGHGPEQWLTAAFKVGSGSGKTARRVRLVLIAPGRKTA